MNAENGTDASNIYLILYTEYTANIWYLESWIVFLVLQIEASALSPGHVSFNPAYAVS